MRTKNVIIVLFVLSIPVLMSAIMIKTSGAHPGSTGAPGEQTCARSGCHSTASVNPGTGINTFVWPNADSTYVPGQTYTVQVKVANSGIMKFGFELTALKDSNNLEAGTLVVTDATRTHLINAIINGQNRKSITHSTAGTPAITAGNTNWSFNWTAPVTDVGPITFYYATNCTNNNGQNNGDAIYLSSFNIKPKTVGVEESIFEDHDFLASYIRENEQLLIQYKLNVEANLMVVVTDMTGKRILAKNVNSSNRFGKNRELISLPVGISQGYYNITLVAENESLNKKVLVN